MLFNRHNKELCGLSHSCLPWAVNLISDVKLLFDCKEKYSISVHLSKSYKSILPHPCDLSYHLNLLHIELLVFENWPTSGPWARSTLQWSFWKWSFASCDGDLKYKDELSSTDACYIKKLWSSLRIWSRLECHYFPCFLNISILKILYCYSDI